MPGFSGHLRESNHRDLLEEKGSDTCTSPKRIYHIPFSVPISSSMLFLKVSLILRAVKYVQGIKSSQHVTGKRKIYCKTITQRVVIVTYKGWSFTNQEVQIMGLWQLQEKGGRSWRCDFIMLYWLVILELN